MMIKKSMCSSGILKQNIVWSLTLMLFIKQTLLWLLCSINNCPRDVLVSLGLILSERHFCNRLCPLYNWMIMWWIYWFSSDLGLQTPISTAVGPPRNPVNSLATLSAQVAVKQTTDPVPAERPNSARTSECFIIIFMCLSWYSTRLLI